MANAWDAGSARPLEGGGFAPLGTTSAGLAWMKGHQDGATSRDMVLANAQSIANAVDVPVSGDPAKPLFDCALAKERIIAAVGAARSLNQPMR